MWFLVKCGSKKGPAIRHYLPDQHIQLHYVSSNLQEDSQSLEYIASLCDIYLVLRGSLILWHYVNIPLCIAWQMLGYMGENLSELVLCCHC